MTLAEPPMMMVYVTAPNEAEAKRLGLLLVESRLAACANILPSMCSIYPWEGKIQEEQEAVLILKTRQDRLPSLSKKIQESHPYKCPCILAWPLSTGNPEYLSWLNTCLGTPESGISSAENRPS